MVNLIIGVAGISILLMGIAWYGAVKSLEADYHDC